MTYSILNETTGVIIMTLISKELADDALRIFRKHKEYSFRMITEKDD